VFFDGEICWDCGYFLELFPAIRYIFLGRRFAFESDIFVCLKRMPLLSGLGIYFLLGIYGFP
jgi:hypothetical protein